MCLIPGNTLKHVMCAVANVMRVGLSPAATAGSVAARGPQPPISSRAGALSLTGEATRSSGSRIRAVCSLRVLAGARRQAMGESQTMPLQFFPLRESVTIIDGVGIRECFDLIASGSVLNRGLTAFVAFIEVAAEVSPARMSGLGPAIPGLGCRRSTSGGGTSCRELGVGGIAPACPPATLVSCELESLGSVEAKPLQVGGEPGAVTHGSSLRRFGVPEASRT